MTQRAKALAAATLVAVALSACGGSSDSDSSEDSAAATNTANTSTSPTSSTTTTRSTNTTDTQTTGADRRPSKPEDTSRPEGQEQARRRLPPAQRTREVTLVRQVVSELLSGMNAHDESICARLFDQHLVAKNKRGEAVANCRRRIAQTPGGLELVKIESALVRRTKSGLEGKVQFLARQDKRTIRLAFHLVRARDGYRIDTALAVDQPGS